MKNHYRQCVLYPFPAQGRRPRPLDLDLGRGPSWGICLQELAHRHDAGLWQRSWGVSQISSPPGPPRWGEGHCDCSCPGWVVVAPSNTCHSCPGNSSLLWGGSRVCFLRPSSESIKCKTLHDMGWMVPPALFSLSSKICLKIKLCNCGFSSLAIGERRNEAKRCFNHRSFRLSECMDYSELSVLLSRGFEGSALTLFAEVHGFQLCQMQLGTAHLFQIHQGFITWTLEGFPFKWS